MARTKGSLGKKTLLNMGQTVKPVIKKETGGKRGRPKLDKTFNTVLPVIKDHKVKTFVPESYTTDLIRVEKLSGLSGMFCHMVSGCNNYSEAVAEAKRIASENNYQIVNYYEQRTFNRSIIFSYNKLV